MVEIKRIIGIIGIFIYTFLLLQALYWLYQPFKKTLIKVKYYNYKFIFQGVFTFYALLEIIYYSSLIITTKYTLWAYGLHKFSLFLSVVLFAMVINLWGYALNYENIFQLSSYYSVIIIVLNFFVTLGDIIFMCTTSDYYSYTHNLNASSIPTIIHIISLLVLVLILIAHCIQLSIKLNQHYSASDLALNNFPPVVAASPQSPVGAALISSNNHNSSLSISDPTLVSVKFSLLTRLHIILHICFWCYFLRILLLSIKVYSRVESGVDTGPIYYLPLPIWFTLNNWIPNVIPSILFIYMMRTTELNSNERVSLERLPSISSWVSWYYSESDGTGIRSGSGNQTRDSSLEPARFTFNSTRIKSMNSRGRKDTANSGDDDNVEI